MIKALLLAFALSFGAMAHETFDPVRAGTCYGIASNMYTMHEIARANKEYQATNRTPEQMQGIEDYMNSINEIAEVSFKLTTIEEATEHALYYLHLSSDVVADGKLNYSRGVETLRHELKRNKCSQVIAFDLIYNQIQEN